MNNKLEEKEVSLLKSQIGFGTAFKATLGFYTAKIVVGIFELILFGFGILVLGTICYFIFK